jgi:hypothetical protein
MKQADIYFFNPTCEYAVANGNASWQPNRILQKMEYDLATLPLFFAFPHDLILVDRIPSENFINQFEKIGFTLPRLVLKNDFLYSNNLQKQAFNKLAPWGWSPAAHKILARLKPGCSAEFLSSPVAHWKPEHRDLYSKGFALTILKELIRTAPSDVFITEDLIPEICTTREQFEDLISRWEKLMVKAPWGSSGRGLQPVTKTPVHAKVWEKILGIVNGQGYAIVEPLLEKAADLSFQFEMKEGRVSFLGTSNFSTDKKGRYQGNFLNGLPDSYSEEIKNFIKNVPGIIIEPLISIIENSELAKLYEGNFGVDTLIFRDKKNQLKINPCLEINVRLNMGLLSLHLEKLVYPGKKGIFRTFYNPAQNFLSFKKEMEKGYPFKIRSQKIESGFFPLTDATADTRFGAYILIL